MKIVGKTDIGRVRNENQDNYRAGRQQDNTIWAVVCDGMGGEARGSVASATAVKTMEELFVNGLPACQNNDDIKLLIDDAVTKANAAVYNAALQDGSLSGMGTTTVVAVVCKTKLCYANVGDSRIYLLRDNQLKQLTTDHSLVQDMVNRGAITHDEAEHHPQKNIITRALGAEKKVVISHDEITVQNDDILLLCTDGLTNMVSTTAIKQIINTAAFENTAQILVSEALAAGGHDNVTALLIKICTSEEEDG